MSWDHSCLAPWLSYRTRRCREESSYFDNSQALTKGIYIVRKLDSLLNCGYPPGLRHLCATSANLSFTENGTAVYHRKWYF